MLRRKPETHRPSADGASDGQTPPKRAAAELFEEYGERAARFVLEEAEVAFLKDEYEGHFYWMEVLDALRDLGCAPLADPGKLLVATSPKAAADILIAHHGADEAVAWLTRRLEIGRGWGIQTVICSQYWLEVFACVTSLWSRTPDDQLH